MKVIHIYIPPIVASINNASNSGDRKWKSFFDRQDTDQTLTEIYKTITGFANYDMWEQVQAMHGSNQELDVPVACKVVCG